MPTSRNHGTDFGLGDRLSGDLCLAVKPPHVLFPGDLFHVVLDRVARHHRLAELGLVDRQKIDVLWMIAAHLREHADCAGRLRHALDQQYAGKDRVTRKVPKKLRFVHGDILDADSGFVTAHFDDRPLADPDVVREPNLSRQDDAILDNDAAGDAALRDDDAVAADRHIVSDLHQVVDLGPFADHGVADAAAVDGGAGTDLYVVL